MYDECEEAVIQNLRDAGCMPEAIALFMRLYAEGESKEALRVIYMQRNELLQKIHADEKRIQCLDYLMYKLRFQEGTSGTRGNRA